MSTPREGPGDPGDPVEIEWQFDALDLRPVERWLATLPTLAVETDDGGTVTALARTPRRLTDSYLDTDDWRIARAGFVLRTRRRGRQDEITLKDTRPAEGSGLRQRLEVTEILPPSGPCALGVEGPVGRRLHAIVGLPPAARGAPGADAASTLRAARGRGGHRGGGAGRDPHRGRRRAAAHAAAPRRGRGAARMARRPRADRAAAADLVRAPAGQSLEVRGGPARARPGDPRFARSRPDHRVGVVDHGRPCLRCVAAPTCRPAREGARVRAWARTSRSSTTCASRRGACVPRSRCSPPCSRCGPRPSGRNWAGWPASWATCATWMCSSRGWRATWPSPS